MNTNKRSFHFDREHGSLYDRGAADSYYGRPRQPHWYPEGTYYGPKVLAVTEAEVAEYEAGFRDNEESGNFKDWSKS